MRTEFLCCDKIGNKIHVGLKTIPLTDEQGTVLPVDGFAKSLRWAIGNNCKTPFQLAISITEKGKSDKHRTFKIRKRDLVPCAA